MLKTLKTLFKQDKEKFVIPKSVQAIIPIKTIWEDGIFLVGNNKYAKTFTYSTIDLSFLGLDKDKDVESLGQKILTLAAPYVPLDGVNDAGVACGIFMSYQGEGKGNTTAGYIKGSVG